MTANCKRFILLTLLISGLFTPLPVFGNNYPTPYKSQSLPPPATYKYKLPDTRQEKPPYANKNDSYSGGVRRKEAPRAQSSHIQSYRRKIETHERNHLAHQPYMAENGSYRGEISKNTGRPKDVHVKGYYRKDGTYVRGHYRSKRR